MELINYDSFTTDQLKEIKNNIDRRLKEDSMDYTPPPTVCIKVISNVNIFTSLNKKGFIYNNFADSKEITSWQCLSIDEIVERNSNSILNCAAYIPASSSYIDYSVHKESVYDVRARDSNGNNHSIRPLFLFKE